MYSTRKAGVALHKLKDGENEIRVTAKNKDGKLLYPNPIIINKSDAIGMYGINIINNHNLKGIWIPLENNNERI